MSPHLTTIWPRSSSPLSSATAAFLTSPARRAAVAPGGSTDRTFSVIDPSGLPRLTVRVARPGYAARLHHEQRILNELAQEFAGSGRMLPRPSPRVTTLIEDAALAERWLLVHEHMPGSPAPLAQVTVSDCERLGECLAWVHSHRRDGYMIWPSLNPLHDTRADLYRDRLATLDLYQSARNGMPDVADLFDRLNAATLPTSAGWHERDFALCHGDLSIGNILWSDDSVALIDWEFARDGDPAEDLAYLIAEQDASPDLVAEIAEAYVAASGDAWVFARLPVWLPLVTLDAALWWADYHLARGADPAGEPDVTRRLARVT